MCPLSFSYRSIPPSTLDPKNGAPSRMGALLSTLAFFYDTAENHNNVAKCNRHSYLLQWAPSLFLAGLGVAAKAALS